MVFVMTHDLPVCTLMFVAIAHGAADEIVTPKFHYDFAIGDNVCFREYDECSNRFTRATPVMARILHVSSHYADLSRIPWGNYLVSFAPLKAAASVPVAPKNRDLGTFGQYIPRAVSGEIIRPSKKSEAENFDRRESWTVIGYRDSWTSLDFQPLSSPHRFGFLRVGN